MHDFGKGKEDHLSQDLKDKQRLFKWGGQSIKEMRSLGKRRSFSKGTESEEMLFHMNRLRLDYGIGEERET